MMGGALGLGLAAAAGGWTGVLPLPRAAAAGDLLNPGFEEVADAWPTGWEPFNTASQEHIRSAQDVVHGGSQSVRIADRTTTSIGLRSARLPIAAGTTYEGSVQVFVETGRTSVYLEFWDEAGTRIFSTFQETLQLGTWHSVMLSGAAPEEATHATLLLYSRSPTKAPPGSMMLRSSRCAPCRWSASAAPPSPPRSGAPP
ncbi:hypothetical protein GCM10023160_09960 [Brachybacterium paraconglomeratum]